LSVIIIIIIIIIDLHNVVALHQAWLLGYLDG